MFASSHRVEGYGAHWAIGEPLISCVRLYINHSTVVWIKGCRERNAEQSRAFGMSDSLGRCWTPGDRYERCGTARNKVRRVGDRRCRTLSDGCRARTDTSIPEATQCGEWHQSGSTSVRTGFLSLKRYLYAGEISRAPLSYNSPHPCPGFGHMISANRRKGLRCLFSTRERSLYFLTNSSQSVSHAREGRSPYLLLFATDADGELKIPIRNAAVYQTLCEGRPARLRKCKVMIRVFDRSHWFLVTTRHSDDGTRNRSIYETTGFSWNGPLMVARLEKRGKSTPTGILSSEHHQAAIAAVERFVVQPGMRVLLTRF